MKDLNLPQFYIGQKVEFIGPSGHGFINGDIYTVLNCYKACECSDLGSWAVNVGISYNSRAYCPYCNKTGINHPSCILFRPVQEAKPPLIKLTLSKIQETEKEQILIES